MPQLSPEHALIALVASLGAPWLGRRAWAVWRTLAGALYLGAFDLRALGVVVLASLLLWGLGAPASRFARWALPMGILVFVGLFAASHLDGVVAPLGFAFLLLRGTHYWVERAAGNLPPHRWIDVFGWLSYLPTVLVGPVQRFEDWLVWESRHRFDALDLATGLRRVLYGYAKLVVLAYGVCGGWLPDRLLGLPPLLASGITGFLVLYFSFAGLSDIAIGLGRIWGQRIPENFASPLTQPSLPRFWQSWHMTVGAFCRTYVYLPMLSRTRRPLLAAAAAIAVFALWHEPGLPWLAWGAWHGLGVVLFRRLSPEDAPRTLPGRALSTLLTWTWVLVGVCGLTAWPRGEAWWMR